MSFRLGILLLFVVRTHSNVVWNQQQLKQDKNKNKNKRKSNNNNNNNNNDDDDVCMTISLLCCRVVMCGGG